MASMLEACRANQGLPAKLMAGPRTGYDLSRVGAGEGRGFNGKKKLTASPWSGTWPAPGATLDLDFANNRGFVRGVGQGRAMDAVTFTRASNGNYVNEQGLLVGGGTGNQTGANLLTFPQDFDNAAWTKPNLILAAKAATAPDGTLTASFVNDNATGLQNYSLSRSISTQAATTYTYSCYAKKALGATLTLSTRSNSYNLAGAVFDLETNTVSTGAVGSGWSVVSTSIVELADEWKRCVFTFVTPATSITIYLGAVNFSGTFGYPYYTGDGTSGIFIWGAQLELGSTATEYFPTNINVPRFDWAGTASFSMDTYQIFRYTGDFNNAYWAKVAVSTSQNAAQAPDGTNFAQRITCLASSGEHSISRNFGNVPGEIYHTLSVYAKAAEYRYIALQMQDNWYLGNAIVQFDLLNGTAKRINTGHTGETWGISDEGNGWYRCHVSSRRNLVSTPKIFAVETDGVLSFTGDGSSGVYLWGPQLELKSSISPTRYVDVGALVPSYAPLLPVPTCNGLLIEEARTNRLLWCRDATQTQWVKTDITAAKDQTGIDGVANAASSLTATADGGTCIQTITLASGSRTGSVYLKRLAGSGDVQVSLDGTTWSTVELSATEWRRIVLSGTVTNPVVGIKLAVSGDVVAMDFGQMEDVATAGAEILTSPILTTNATATRASDLGTLGGQAFSSFADPAKGTLYAEVIFYNDVSTQAYFLSAGAPFNISLRRGANSGSNTISAWYNTGTGGSVGSNPVDKGVVVKAAFSYQYGRLIVAVNGQVMPTFSRGFQLFAAFLQLGSATNGALRRASYFPRAMSEGEIGVLTT